MKRKQSAPGSHSAQVEKLPHHRGAGLRPAQSFFITLLVVLSTLPGARLQAAAWPRPKGNGQMILNFTGYHASGSFDASGDRHSFLYGGKFRKYEFNPYVEYGLTNRMTVVGSFFLPAMSYTDSYNRFRSAGSGDAEFGLRYRINRMESWLALSVQGLVKVPAYSRDRNPAPGNHQLDWEGRVLLGRSFALRGFWNVETAYRRRNGIPADQVRLDLTLGSSLGRRWMGLAQVFNIKGLGGGGIPGGATNPNITPSFDLYKAQLSLVYRLRPALRVQFGWTGDVYGRRTGAGNALLLSFWQEF